MPKALAATAIAALMATPVIAQPVTLACEGTISRPNLPSSTGEPITIVVNFAAGTVSGFLFPAKLNLANDQEHHIGFSGESGNSKIIGYIDRVTGDVFASITGAESGSHDLELKCKPAQRMF
jgi:hypothetical protein